MWVHRHCVHIHICIYAWLPAYEIFIRHDLRLGFPPRIVRPLRGTTAYLLLNVLCALGARSKLTFIWHEEGMARRGVRGSGCVARVLHAQLAQQQQHRAADLAFEKIHFSRKPHHTNERAHRDLETTTEHKSIQFAIHKNTKKPKEMNDFSQVTFCTLALSRSIAGSTSSCRGWRQRQSA